MRAIMVMFDSLNRNLLEPYGCDWTKTPNFKRLAEHTVKFDNCYVGSLPCMPARRELHTGRSCFLHRGWGPLEPFDDSMPEILKENNIYTHLVSDHQHYWEDGGATYHTRYSSWECSRGQEGDPWKAVLPVKAGDESLFHSPIHSYNEVGGVRYRDKMNRTYTATEETMPQAVTFENGLEFLRTNYQADDWFLQIETFDPHEPFFTTEEYKKLYPHIYDGKSADWPCYYPVQEDEATISHVRYEYAALLSMCDAYLGKVLDFMDQHDMWKDTMLIVNTDHGFLLGEHDWWGKNIMPVYDELANIPLFVWDPRLGIKGETRSSLTQTIDMAPTLLEFFGVTIPKDMDGKPVATVIKDDTKIHDYVAYGYFGGHVNITDGKYTYMKAPVDISNQPLYEYTLMPNRMNSRFSTADLQDLELASPFSFTKNCKTLKVKASDNYVRPFRFGNKLFHIAKDPEQLFDIDDVDTEIHYIDLLCDYLKSVDAPAEQYERLGLPQSGSITKEDVLAQREKRENCLNPGILEDYTWEGGVKYQFLSLLDYKPESKEQIKQQFAAFAEKLAISRTVTTDLILDFMEKIVDEEHLQMMRYGMLQLGRGK